MRLPGDFHYKADRHAGVFVGAAESVNDVKFFARKLFFGKVSYDAPGLFAHGMVVVLVSFGGPPYGVFGIFVHNDVFVFGRTAGVDAGHNVYGAQLGEHAFVVPFERRIHLVFKKLFVRRVADDLGSPGDTVFGKIDFCHESYLFPFVVF